MTGADASEECDFQSIDLFAYMENFIILDNILQAIDLG